MIHSFSLIGFVRPDPYFSHTCLPGTVSATERLAGQHGVSTGSGSDRVSLAISGMSHNDPVATAPGTDLILKVGHYKAPAIPG